MKRYPKHARPLWGVPKRRRPIDHRSCYSLDRHEPVTITISFAGSTGPASPREIEAMTVFHIDGTTPNVNIDPGTVLVLPPVEVRL